MDADVLQSYFLYGNTFHYSLIYANGGRGQRGMAMFITSEIILLCPDSYYDLTSRGKKIIVSSQIDLLLLENTFGEFARQQIMTFGQSHTNKQLRQTIRCNYDYCFSEYDFITT